MAAASTIEWTETTWNPVTGCTKISPGCKHCYAERMARRLKGMGVSVTTSTASGSPSSRIYSSTRCGGKNRRSYSSTP